MEVHQTLWWERWGYSGVDSWVHKSITEHYDFDHKHITQRCIMPKAILQPTWCSICKYLQHVWHLPVWLMPGWNPCPHSACIVSWAEQTCWCSPPLSRYKSCCIDTERVNWFWIQIWSYDKLCESDSTVWFSTFCALTQAQRAVLERCWMIWWAMRAMSLLCRACRCMTLNFHCQGQVLTLNIRIHGPSVLA